MRDFLERFFGATTGRDSLVTVHLEEALAQPGCPLCRLVGKTELHYFEAFFYENVNDPGVHRELLASRGFCHEHTWTIPAASVTNQSPTGVAIVYERFLTDLRRNAASDAQLQRWLDPDAPCPVCRVRGDTTRSYLTEYARLAAERPPGGADGAGVLCQPHLGALAAHTAPAVQAAVAEATAGLLADPDALGERGRLALIAGRQPARSAAPSARCPVCAVAAEAAQGVQEVTALCRHHAWELYEAGRREVASAMREVVPEAACPACQAAAAATAGALARLTDGGPLCLHHLRLALDRGRPVRPSAVVALARLGADLAAFRDSADFYFTGTIDAEERISWLTALACFGGEAVGAAVARALPFTGGRDG